MNTGENEQGLRKIIDMTRLISITLLLIHFYYYGYSAFARWHLRSLITDHLLENIIKTGLLDNAYKSKLIALGFLILSMLGARGKKSEKLNYRKALVWLVAGIGIYLSSTALLCVVSDEGNMLIITYIIATSFGYLFALTGGGLLARIIKDKLKPDIFNKHNETFPQEERLLINEYSINLRSQYKLKGKTRDSFINIINPMRGLLVIGSPGSGKSYFVIESVIKQHMAKGFTMFIYDYKYDDLTRLAYNCFLKNKGSYKIPPAFYVINIDEPSYSHRCNPLDPENMHDITDAVEAARVILLGLNRSWLKKQGEFFVESPINFLTALIWFLRKFQDGAYCTLPHVIELMQVDIEKLFTILRIEPEIEAYINPFISAFMTNSMEQLEGQLDAAKISMARLSSPVLYYLLSGNDFTLDINDPKTPKIVCLANNPQKQDVFGPVLSLYITRMTKIINKKSRLKSSLIIDEFTTLTFLGFDTLIATGRSNKISTTLAIQDSSQLKLNYGKELSDVIVNICGNIIVGQANGELAKQVSERIGKIIQQRESMSINSNDTSISRSTQLEMAVPVSTISSLSSGEFVGLIADNPEQTIQLKAFHATIINDHDKLNQEKISSYTLPKIRNMQNSELHNNYKQVKQDIKDISDMILEQILNSPDQLHLILRK